MSTNTEHERRFEDLIREIFAELGDFESSHQAEADAGCDLVVESKEGQKYRFQLKARERVTPQIADDVFSRIQADPIPENVTRVFIAPVISERVQGIAKEHGISFMDYAGNCLIVNHRVGLLISRTGKKTESHDSELKTADVFSPKSSRIVRAMLHEPLRGWKVQELAKHPDIVVSVGLASRVKRTLVKEGYAQTRDRLLYLKRPNDLLADWAQNCSGPIESRQFYVRGEVEDIEQKIAQWCGNSGFEYALARHSAAWRLAPDVRYSMATFYVGTDLLTSDGLESLRSECGAKEVDSGANLTLLIPYDGKVYVRATGNPLHTSAIQTYVDVINIAGRGGEAANAIFNKYLRKTFDQVERPDTNATGANE